MYLVTYKFIPIISCLCRLQVFVPKVIAVWQEGAERSDRSSAPEGGTTKEDEERYGKLLGENETLQQILGQKEERLKLLRNKLEEKNVARRRVEVVSEGERPPPVTVPPTTTPRNNNLEQIEVCGSVYQEPSESGIGQGLSVTTRTPTTTDFELSESYL